MTAAQFCGSVRPGSASRAPSVGAVEVADDDRHVTEAVGGEVRGQLHERAAARLDERLAQREVLDRVCR